MDSMSLPVETQHLPRPTLLHGRRNPKYGRYDFERFDHLSSSIANIGYNTFHKVNVNCRFLFKKSRWGVLGDNKNPAGIIYLDLTFDQPKDCQLHSATVIVTLDDKDEELRIIEEGLRIARRRHSDSRCPVNLTDCYGPKGFAGPEKIVLSKKSLHFTPSAQFGGFGVGGLGFDRESSLKYSSRWKFSGNLQGKNSTDWTYKALKWELSENDLESQPTHSNEIHTAFTFEHGGQPFFMRVEIKGKLKKMHARVKDKLMKFPSSANKDDGSIVTLINFGNHMRFQTPLDERAKELAYEMEMANLDEIPMEVSDPKPVTFLEMPQNPTMLNASNTANTSTWSRPQTSVSGHLPTHQLPAPLPAQLLQNDGVPAASETRTDPTLANLAQAFVDLQTMNGRVPRQEESPRSPPATTASNDTGTAVSSSQLPLRGAKVEQKLSPEQAVVQQLLRMPGFLIFIRMIAGLVGFFRQTPVLTAMDVGKDRKQPKDKQGVEMKTS